MNDPNWWLVGLAFVTFAAAWYQARTARAVQTTKDSVRRAQEQFQVTNQEWLAVSEWHGVVSEPIAAPDAPGAKPGAYHLTVGFIVTNTTKLPVTIQRVQCFSPAPETELHASLIIVGGSPLAPDGGRYHVESVRFRLTPSQVAGYTGASGLSMPILGRIEFVDGLGAARRQLFGRRCRVTHRGDAQFEDLNMDLQRFWDLWFR